jgi:hypothetical protein
MLLPLRCCFERVEPLHMLGSLHRRHHNNHTIAVIFRRRWSTTTTTTTTVHTPSEDETVQRHHILLILGKPGGGKGTISGKILQVRACFFYPCSMQQQIQPLQDKTELQLCFSFSSIFDFPRLSGHLSLNLSFSFDYVLNRTFRNFITYRRVICCVKMYATKHAWESKPPNT